MIKYETDSRKIKEGQIFVAIKGHTVDGHDYILNAIENGASKIISEKDICCNVPVEVVSSTEEYLKEHLKNEYANTINEMNLIGVTGTNGKTTTCYLLYQLLNLLGEKSAYMGTIGFKYEDMDIVLENTTPDILTMYKLLYDAKNRGCKTIAMEVSSHALSFDRIYGLQLSSVGFTNLTEDHLDYHKTMENYLNEKLKIINYLKNKNNLLVNSDDNASIKFIEKNGTGKTLGLNGDFKILDYDINPSKTKIEFSYLDKSYEVITNLTSKFNIYNYLTALGLLVLEGYNIEDIISVTKNVKAPKGRCETYEVNNGYAVIDYAHTPDAVEKVIEAYTELKKNKLITIVGCGGDRDPIKRPIMGNIATRLSDYTILTTDNPRTEDPKNIMNDIIKGVDVDNYEVILDRREAIKHGIDMLEKDDILLILGKGHEDYQIIGKTKYHFDDAEEVLNWNK